MTNTKQLKKAKLQKLQLAYSEQLADKFSDILGCWRDLQQQPDRHNLLNDLKRLVHSLAGSAGMFGFSSIRNHAKKLEIVLTNIEKGEWSLVEKQDLIADMLEQLVVLGSQGSDKELESSLDEWPDIIVDMLEQLVILGNQGPDKKLANQFEKVVANKKQAKQQKLQKLQLVYSEQLADKFFDIIECWRELMQNPASKNVLYDMKRLIHNLASSAGTFSFSSIRNQAKKLEMVLIKIEKGEGSLVEKQKLIADMLEQLVMLGNQGPDDKQEYDLNNEYKKESEPESNALQIYIVETNTHIAEEMVEQLESFGYELNVFQNCESVLAALCNQVPSAIVINYSSEDVEKYIGQLTKRLASEPIKVPFIFISDTDNWNARLGAVRSGADAFITMPVDYNLLLDRLAGTLHTHEMEPYRVLIIDDVVKSAEHYRLVLENAGMHAMTINNPEMLLEVADSFKPELILMAILMPECSGIEAAKVIRQKDEFLSVPIVFLSSESEQNYHLQALRLGGDDFLQMPISDEQLIEAVTTRAERFRALRAMMHQDSLTGLFNHITIKLRLEAEMARARRHSSDLIFAMLDIDKFKAVNDRYGHPTGDRVIKSLARLLKQRMRKSDIIGRYGGEEFAVIMPDTTVADAKLLFGQLREQFATLIHHHDQIQFTNTFSAGIAGYSNQPDYNVLIKQADAALYMAKQLGRNQNCIYDEIE